MKRNEFLTALGVSAGTVFFAPFLASCSKNSSILGTGGTVDFTLDLTQPANAALKNVGGSVVTNRVIVARTSGGYIALSSVCTHQGGTLYFNNASNRFVCPEHGANFSTSGSVLLGPASSPLTNYSTTLTGTSLRIY